MDYDPPEFSAAINHSTGNIDKFLTITHDTSEAIEKDELSLIMGGGQTIRDPPRIEGGEEFGSGD